MSEPEYVDPITERVVALMHERALTTEIYTLSLHDALPI